METVVGDGTLVLAHHALQDGALPVGRVDLFTGLDLDLADFQDVPCPLVQQSHDLLVQLVNGLPMFL